MEMTWALGLGLGVLASLTAAALIGLANLLRRKRAERKLEAAVADDSTLRDLRASVTQLDEALHPIPTPARDAGDDAANRAVQKWKNGLSVAMSHLQFTVPDLPQRLGLDLDLVDRIERMEQMADEAVRELGQQAGLCGQRGDEAVYTGTKWGCELLSEARLVLDFYETALREHLRRQQRRQQRRPG